MLARLFVGGVAWLVAVVMFAALLHWSASPPAGIDSSRDGVTALARSLNRLRPESKRHPWTVTKATSALRSLVVEVEAIDPGDARQIAGVLIASVHTQYDEILVYVQAVDVVRQPRIQRVEWTPRRGYLTSAF